MAEDQVAAEHCFVLVRGTEFNFFRWAASVCGLSDGLPGWVKPLSPISQKLREAFPQSHVTAFAWPGSHTAAARARAADTLALQLRQMRRHYQRIVLIGHSHGGNVAIRAAYQVPLANVDVVTLNTPFVAARMAAQSELSGRLWKLIGFGLMISFLLVAFFGLLFWPDQLVLWISGGAVFLIGIITATKCGVSVDFTQLIATFGKRKGVHDQSAMFRVRKGSRCLVVTHKMDEVIETFNELSGWTKKYLKSESQPNLPSDLFVMAPAFLAAALLFLIGRPLISTLGWLPLVVVMTPVFVLLTWMLLASAMMNEMGQFIVAGALRAFGLPVYTQGFGSAGLHSDAVLRDVPQAEPGAVIERFYSDLVIEPKPFLIFDHPGVDWSSGLMRQFAEVCYAFAANFFSLGVIAYSVLRAKVHRAPYRDPKILTKICVWI